MHMYLMVNGYPSMYVHGRRSSCDGAAKRMTKSAQSGAYRSPPHFLADERRQLGRVGLVLFDARMTAKAGPREHDGVDAAVAALAELVHRRAHIAGPLGAFLHRVHAAQRAHDVGLGIERA